MIDPINDVNQLEPVPCSITDHGKFHFLLYIYIFIDTMLLFIYLFTSYFICLIIYAYFKIIVSPFMHPFFF